MVGGGCLSWATKLTSHLHAEPSLRISGTRPPLPLLHKDNFALHFACTLNKGADPETKRSLVFVLEHDKIQVCCRNIYCVNPASGFCVCPAKGTQVHCSLCVARGRPACRTSLRVISSEQNVPFLFHSSYKLLPKSTRD